MKSLVLSRLFVISLIFTTSAAAAATAEQSNELVKQGEEELGRQEYKKALEKFDAGLNADKDDLQALFFKAVTLNRMGRFREAVPVFNRLKSKGLKHPDLDFERGWSLMGAKSWQGALSSFENYEKAHPGRGQTIEFMGRCYLALGQLDKAEAALNEAVARDPKLKPTVEFYLALLEVKRSNKEAVAQHLTASLETDSSLGRALRGIFQVRPPPPEPAQQKKFGIAVSVLAGYNNNVIALGNTIPLPADISRKGSNFERLSMNLAYSLPMPNSGLNIGYALLADNYDTMSQVNLIDHFIYADYLRAFSEKLSGSVRISDEYTLSGGQRFRNQISLRPALAYRFTGSSATEFSYAYSASDYLFNSSVAAWNRDGHSNAIGVTHYLFMDGKPFANIGYSSTRNQSVGADFSFKSESLSVKLGHSLVYGIDGEAAYAHTQDRYDNANTLSILGLPRSDDTDNFTAQLTKPVNKNVNLFIRYTTTRAHSNTPFYSYDQSVTYVGITARY